MCPARSRMADKGKYNLVKKDIETLYYNIMSHREMGPSGSTKSTDEYREITVLKFNIRYRGNPTPLGKKWRKL